MRASRTSAHAARSASAFTSASPPAPQVVMRGLRWVCPPTLRLRWVRCLAPSSLPAGGGSSTRAANRGPTHAPAARPGTLGAPSGEVGSWERRCAGSPHPYSEYGFEAGGCSGCGRTHSRAERSRIVRYTLPKSAQQSPLKGAGMRGGRGRRGGPGPQPGARRPNLVPSHCDNRRTQSGCARTLLMCGVPTEAGRTMLETAEPRLAKTRLSPYGPASPTQALR